MLLLVRKRNTVEPSYFESRDPISLYNSDDEVYYSGLYRSRRISSFLNVILSYHAKDFSLVHSNLNFLETKKGIASQRKLFKENSFTPVYRWCKSRGIYDKEVFISLVWLKFHGEFDSIAKILDERKEYTFQSLLLAKYLSSHSSKSSQRRGCQT